MLLLSVQSDKKRDAEVDVPIRLPPCYRRGNGHMMGSHAAHHHTRDTNMSDIALYELAGADPAVRFSPHCWKTRMALAHKGLEAERIAWRFREKSAIAFSAQGSVPVLVDHGETINDSWEIALHLEKRYPGRPSLFGSPPAISLARFINGWCDGALLPVLARLILLDIHAVLDPADQDYFRISREKRFGATLEEVVTDRAANERALLQTLAPLRQTLKGQAFLTGEQPGYGDYCVFGMFMWVRCVSPIALIADDDPINAWRERLLDAFDGLARNSPRATL
jgi:glutathione S-transferase